MRDPAEVRREVRRLRATTDDLPPGERDEVFRRIAALLRELKRVEPLSSPPAGSPRTA